MTQTIKILPILLIFSLIFTFGCAGKKATSQDQTLLAKLSWPEEERITLKDLENEINQLPEYKRDRYKDQKGKQEYLAEVTENRMLVAVAKNLGLDKDPETVSKINEYRHQLMVEKLVEQEIDQKALASTTDEDLKKYYDEHLKDYIEPEKVRLTCITATDKKRAEEIYNQIKDGADIAKLAKESSDKGENVGPGGRAGGDTGFFSREDYSMAPNLVEVAFKLENGQISELVEQEVQNALYYMIFRLEEKNPEHQKPLGEVKDDIRREVENAKKKARMDEWLKELYKRSNMKISLDKLPPPPTKEEEKSESQPEQPEQEAEPKPEETKEEER